MFSKIILILILVFSVSIANADTIGTVDIKGYIFEKKYYYANKNKHRDIGYANPLLFSPLDKAADLNTLAHVS